jgi:hypothetical protein
VRAEFLIVLLLLFVRVAGLTLVTFVRPGEKAGAEEALNKAEKEGRENET